jgi:hypothetical protein
MERSTMNAWVQECSCCGYSAPQISKLFGDVECVVNQPEYRALAQAHQSGLLPRFQRWAIIAEAASLTEEAAYARICCAWLADDSGDEHRAANFRRAAATCYESLDSSTELTHNSENKAALIIRLAVTSDLWRRAGDWDRARSAAERGISAGADGVVRTVLEFELNAIEKRLHGRYTVADAGDWSNGRT